MLDPENPVIKLCVVGMEAEAANRFATARTLFEQAWAARQSNLDACIAAHYLARHQTSLERILHWNQEALRYAEMVCRESTTESNTGATNEPPSPTQDRETAIAFYPSLYLNLGKSHEELGDLVAARYYYELAAEKNEQIAPALHESAYSTTMARGIAAALHRTQKS